MTKEEKLISRIKGIIAYCKTRTEECLLHSEDWKKLNVESLASYYDGKYCTYKILGEWLETTIKELEE